MKQSVADWYSKVYERESPGSEEVLFTGWPKSRLQACVFWAGEGGRILDIGCGNGQVLYSLRQKYSCLLGIELALARSNTALSTLSAIGGSIVRGDVEAGLPFHDDSLDAIVCADVIEHLIDPGGALRDMNRVLRSEGRMLLITPNVASIRRRLQLLRGEFPHTSTLRDRGGETALLDGGHLHYFTFSSIERLVRAAGFTVLDRRGFGRLGKFHDCARPLLSPSCVIVAAKSC